MSLCTESRVLGSMMKSKRVKIAIPERATSSRGAPLQSLLLCAFGLLASSIAMNVFAANVFVVRAVADDRVVPEARIESVRGVALGTGARAAAVSTQAQAENPANLVGAGVYHLEAFMGYQPTFKRMGYGAAIVDSMTSRLAAGISARALMGDNSAGENSGWEGRIGLGFPFGDSFSLGVAGRYANFTISDQRAKRENDKLSPPAEPDRTFKLNAFTLDAAATLRLIDALSISALGYNLIDTGSPLAPVMAGGAASVRLGDGVSLGGDALVDMNTHKSFNGPKLQVGGGLEFLASGVIPLRGGYMFDQGRKQHAVTGGIGFVDTTFGLQVSLRQVVSGGSESTVMAALQYFVQ